METRVQVFAKAPVAGEVKTRLIPRLGAAGAAALHSTLVERSLRTALDAAVGPVELWCAPARTHPAFRPLIVAGVHTRNQGEGDLGTRMQRALADAQNASSAAILIGSDCPALGVKDLREAATALNEGLDAVFTPVEDGGYALIAVRRADKALFEGIAWSSDTVMEQTRVRMTGLGWHWRELALRWDVDRPEDYERLLREGLFGQPA